jgi:hypothetical protein
MAEIEKSLHWCRQRRKQAIADITDLSLRHVQHFELTEGKRIDTTRDWVVELNALVNCLDHQIKVYEGMRH